MRLVMALLGLALITVAPAFATIETTIYDYSYQLAPTGKKPGITIDWSRQAVIITTIETAPVKAMGPFACASARELALESARQELAAYYGALRLTAYSTVNNVIFTGYLPRDVVRIAPKTVRPLAESWNPESRAITLVSVASLVGPGSPTEIAARMLKLEQDAFAKSDPLQIYKPMYVVPNPNKQPVKQLSAGPYTGVILDCTQMHYQPVLLPKLFAENGAVLWGLRDITPTAVADNGMNGFALSIKEAVKSGRAGTHPLIIRPTGTSGPLQGDLVLSDEDAQLLTNLQSSANCVSKLAVIFLLD